MRGSRKQRQRDLLAARCLLLVVLAWLSACTRPAAHNTTDPYQEALLDLRRGNLVAAQKRVDDNAPIWRDRPDSGDYWKYRALQAEILINRGRSKDALALLEKDPPDTPALQSTIGRIKIVRVKALVRLQRIDEARALLDQTEDLASRTGQNSLLTEIEILKGIMLDASRRPAEAEAAYSAALRHAEEQKDSYWQTVILNNLGIARVRQFRWDEAIPFLTRAQAGFESMNANLYAAIALGNIALCASRLGDFDKASSHYTRAIESEEREGAKPYLQATLGEFGNLYAFQGQFAQAIPYYRRALAIALEIEATSDASKWAGNLATMLSLTQNWDEAERLNQQSSELKQRIKDSDSQTFTRLTSATIAAGRGQLDVAEKLYLQLVKDTADNAGLLWETQAGLGQLYLALGKKDLAFKHFDDAIKVIDSSRAQLSLDHKITFLSSLIRFYQNYVDALIDAGEPDRALQVAESSRALVLDEKFGANRTTANARTPAPNYSQIAQRSGTAFLVYWLAPKRSLAWVIAPRASKFFVLPPQAEIEKLAESYQAFIDDLRDPLESLPLTASKLYEVLLAPARELLRPGSRVVVVPDGRLHNLNFETLLVPDNTPHYWIEDVTMSIAPSLAVNPERRATRPLKSLLLIGNPDVSGTDYQPLPYAAVEVENVGRRMASLQKTIYDGARAEPLAYQSSNPGDYSVIHFAAHASANRDSPLDSAIILSPSNGAFKLYARDVLKQPLHADLVTISSCRGAGARVYSGEGLVGFAWAFLQAGAKNVIAGLWDVNDKSTAQFMDHLYEGIDAGLAPPEALRQAKLAMIHSSDNFRKPYYWAPFQVYIGTK